MGQKWCLKVDEGHVMHDYLVSIYLQLFTFRNMIGSGGEGMGIYIINKHFVIHDPLLGEVQ